MEDCAEKFCLHGEFRTHISVKRILIMKGTFDWKSRCVCGLLMRSFNSARLVIATAVKEVANTD